VIRVDDGQRGSRPTVEPLSRGKATGGKLVHLRRVRGVGGVKVGAQLRVLVSGGVVERRQLGVSGCPGVGAGVVFVFVDVAVAVAAVVAVAVLVDVIAVVVVAVVVVGVFVLRVVCRVVPRISLPSGTPRGRSGWSGGRAGSRRSGAFPLRSA
jgi:hypothetical protein